MDSELNVGYGVFLRVPYLIAPRLLYLPMQAYNRARGVIAQRFLARQRGNCLTVLTT